MAMFKEKNNNIYTKKFYSHLTFQKKITNLLFIISKYKLIPIIKLQNLTKTFFQKKKLGN